MIKNTASLLWDKPRWLRDRFRSGRIKPLLTPLVIFHAGTSLSGSADALWAPLSSFYLFHANLFSHSYVSCTSLLATLTASLLLCPCCSQCQRQLMSGPFRSSPTHSVTSPPPPHFPPIAATFHTLRSSDSVVRFTSIVCKQLRRASKSHDGVRWQRSRG